MTALKYFQGSLVWTGILFVAIGQVGMYWSGGNAFASFLLFGGLFIGMGVERNRHGDVRESES